MISASTRELDEGEVCDEDVLMMFDKKTKHFDEIGKKLSLDIDIDPCRVRWTTKKRWVLTAPAQAINRHALLFPAFFQRILHPDSCILDSVHSSMHYRINPCLHDDSSPHGRAHVRWACGVGPHDDPLVYLAIGPDLWSYCTYRTVVFPDQIGMYVL